MDEQLHETTKELLGALRRHVVLLARGTKEEADKFWNLRVNHRVGIWEKVGRPDLEHIRRLGFDFVENGSTSAGPKPPPEWNVASSEGCFAAGHNCKAAELGALAWGRHLDCHLPGQIMVNVDFQVHEREDGTWQATLTNDISGGIEPPISGTGPDKLIATLIAQARLFHFLAQQRLQVIEELTAVIHQEHQLQAIVKAMFPAVDPDTIRLINKGLDSAESAYVWQLQAEAQDGTAWGKQYFMDTDNPIEVLQTIENDMTSRLDNDQL
jgi:hypothetical protein